MKLTTQQKIHRAHYYIMNSPIWAAYGGIVMLGAVRLSEERSTAWTDGWNVWYNPNFIDALPESAINFVVLHENLHKMFRHLTIWRRLFEMDAHRAGSACDYVINLILEDANDPNVQMPPEPYTGLLDRKYKGMDSGKVFQLLPPTPPCPQCNGNCQPSDGSGGGSPGGQCTCPASGFDEHDWEAADGLGAQEQKERAQEIDSAIRQGAMLAGRIKGRIPREFTELMEVKADYSVLYQFVTAHCKGGDHLTFARPNRRFLHMDLIMPSGITETIESIVIGNDTSGSIGGDALNEFVSHMVACLRQVKPEQIDVLYWDAAVAAHETYRREEIEQIAFSTKPAGGGGTSPSCVTEYLKEKKIKPICAVMLTDGYVGNDWGGEWPCPVLWVIKDNPTAVPTVGAVLHI
jgi:predicted metal-dependent peptidase